MTVQTSGKLKKLQYAYRLGKACVGCGRKLPPDCMTVDHIIPRAFYGNAYDQKNWQPLCEECHRQKTYDETLILSGQSQRVPEGDYTRFAGLTEFRDKINEARERLGYTGQTPMDNSNFKRTGLNFKKP